MGVYTIRFHELERWDVKFYASKLHSNYPIVRLKGLITEHNEKVYPHDFPEETFRILGVDNINGVFHAYDILGKKINQPYKKVVINDFVYNPYRVNIGSIGIVPRELANNYVSPAYVVFSVKEHEILPKILELILQSKWFNLKLRSATAGSVRQNLTYELLKTLEIPVPPLNTQRSIVSRWQEAQRFAMQAEAKIAELEKGIEKQFFADLGLGLPAHTQNPKVFSARWKDFERWSISYNQAVLSSVDVSNGKYPAVELRNLLSMVQYGSSEKANEKENGVPVLRINNIKNGILELADLKHIPLQEKVKTNLLLKDGDILIIRTSGSRNLVGTCAVFHEKQDFVFASYLIRLRVDFEKANPDYVTWLINSRIGRQQVNALSRQIMQNNINSQELRRLKLPLLPLKTQQEIMAHVEASRTEIARQKELAEKIRKDAEVEIEALILGTKKI